LLLHGFSGSPLEMTPLVARVEKCSGRAGGPAGQGSRTAEHRGGCAAGLVRRDGWAAAVFWT